MNILLITTDQQRADTIGAYGNPVCQTPNLDRLAAEGTRFDACRTPNPFCQPARASILTGQYPSTHGVTFNGKDLPADAATRSMATALGAAGYDTGYFGKAHFATTYPFFPTGAIESVEGSALVDPDWTGPYFGFDHNQLLLFGHNMRVAPMMGRWTWCFGPAPFGLHYGQFISRDGVEKAAERLRLMQPEAAGAVWDHTQTWRNALPEEDHPTTWVADRAIDWLGDRSADDPDFFAWVSFTDPHHPMDPPARWFDLYSPDDVREVMPERRADEFDGKPPLHRMWTQGARGREFEWANPGGGTLTDDELATMIAAYYGMVSQLDWNIGRILDTLDERGLADDTLVLFTTDHGELLGDHQMIFKGPMHYEGLLRVALIARGGGFEAGRVVEDPVSTLDIAPTALRAAGLPVAPHHEGTALHELGREWSLTEDDFDVFVRVPLRTVTTDRWKLTRWLDAPDTGELYDLVEDPGEFVNRWDDPAVAGVRDDLLALLAEISPPQGPQLPTVGLVA